MNRGARPGEMSGELSPYELRVVKLVAEGLENSEIAASLGKSTETVKTHMRSVRQKWHLRNRTQIAVRAVRSGIA